MKKHGIAVGALIAALWQKRAALLALLAATALYLPAAAMAKNRLVAVSGHINYYGNAPFAVPAFAADDGTLYALAVAPEADFALDDVLALQGRYVQLDGVIEKPTLATAPAGASGVLVVHAYKDISVRKK